jgi:hypothetical protein
MDTDNNRENWGRKFNGAGALVTHLVVMTD